MFIQWVTDGIKRSVLELGYDDIVAYPPDAILYTNWLPVSDIATYQTQPAFALSSVPNMEIVFKGDQKNS